MDDTAKAIRTDRHDIEMNTSFFLPPFFFFFFLSAFLFSTGNTSIGQAFRARVWGFASILFVLFVRSFCSLVVDNV